MSVNKLSRYDLLAVVAQGKLGPIWDGYDPDIRRKVTIKVAPVDHLSAAAAEALAARFRTEARVAGKLLHPNIVGVYDAGVESGLAYIVTETVTGASLDALMRQPGGVPQDMAGRVAAQTLAALDYAHSKGVAHLGLQPAQVMVTLGGTVKVGDFGAVAAAEPDDSTRAQGSLSEHIRCLAPEQVLGLEATPRADLWAVGVMLYRMWTGHWPFNADSDFGLIQQIIKQPAQSPSARAPQRVPPFGAEHDQLIARALAKAAADRHPSAREFAAELSRIVALEAAAGTLGGTAASRAALLSAVANAAAASPAPAPVPAPAPAPTPVPVEAPTDAPSSAAAQELAHWKRIQASDTAADFAGFVAQYPDSAFADLAQRRLRRLGGSGEDSAGVRSSAPAPLAPAPAPVEDDDRTMVARKPPVAVVPASAHSPASPPAPVPSAPTTDAPKSRRGLGIALAGLVVVAGIVVAMTMRGGGAPAEPSAPAATAPAIAVAPVASAPASEAAPAPTPVAEAPAPAPVASAPMVAEAASAPPVAAAPVKPTQTARELAAARKAAADAARAKAAAAAMVVEPVKPVEPEKPKPPPVVAEAPKPVEAPASVAPAAPSEPCGRRVMIARLACMKEACAKAEWARHPQCVEWRQLEDRRQRGEQQN